MSINFTQYLRPDGRKRQVFIDRPTEVENKARRIVLAGYRFEIEELNDGNVSMTITRQERDWAIKLVPNGPRVPETIDKLIMEFEI